VNATKTASANDLRIREITVADNAAMAGVIRNVMPEFGADGPGFAIHDREVGDMFAAYDAPGHVYYVVELDGRVCGGAGIGKLDGEDGVCELRKMYFLPTLRGRGIGDKLMRQCLDAARRLGYRQCYIETLTGMDAAQKLYEKHGFKPIDSALGNTGHFGCNRFYLLAL